jgi:hypothetical protein
VSPSITLAAFVALEADQPNRLSGDFLHRDAGRPLRDDRHGRQDVADPPGHAVARRADPRVPTHHRDGEGVILEPFWNEGIADHVVAAKDIARDSDGVAWR